MTAAAAWGGCGGLGRGSGGEVAEAAGCREQGLGTILRTSG